jgi:hypothetical protein
VKNFFVRLQLKALGLCIFPVNFFKLFLIHSISHCIFS